MEHDNAIEMQVKYIKSKCTEMQERIGQGRQGSSIFAATFYSIFCNRCGHEWSYSLRLLPKIHE